MHLGTLACVLLSTLTFAQDVALGKYNGMLEVSPSSLPNGYRSAALASSRPAAKAAVLDTLERARRLDLEGKTLSADLLRAYFDLLHKESQLVWPSEDNKKAVADPNHLSQRTEETAKRIGTPSG
jgi:hypothetical protein